MYNFFIYAMRVHSRPETSDELKQSTAENVTILIFITFIFAAVVTWWRMRRTLRVVKLTHLD